MIPTMVSLPERVTLRDWVALNWLGSGDIVEIGSFVGGSAIAILQGMEMARHHGRLHAYDIFTFPKGGHEEAYRALVPVQGESFRKVFNDVTREWGERLVVIQADASEQKWAGPGIEILHIDCSISKDFHEKIALEFYPNLLLHATLVHQDYDYKLAPFIAEMMKKLEPWFTRLGTVETTAYFSLTRKITREDIEQALRPAFAEAA